MYGLKPPGFCGGCGKEISLAKIEKEKPKPATKRIQEDKCEDFDPDGLDVFVVPKINKLSYSVEHDERNKMDLEKLIDIEEFQEFVEEDEARPKPKSGKKRKTAHGRQKDK